MNDFDFLPPHLYYRNSNQNLPRANKELELTLSNFKLK